MRFYYFIYTLFQQRQTGSRIHVQYNTEHFHQRFCFTMAIIIHNIQTCILSSSLAVIKKEPPRKSNFSSCTCE